MLEAQLTLHDGDAARDVVGSEPVQDHPVGHLAGQRQHAGAQGRHVDGDRRGRWAREPEAVHGQRLSAKHDTLAGQRASEHVCRFADAGQRLAERVAVP